MTCAHEFSRANGRVYLANPPLYDFACRHCGVIERKPAPDDVPMWNVRVTTIYDAHFAPPTEWKLNV